MKYEKLQSGDIVTVITEKGIKLGDKIKVANSFLLRLMGLMFRSKLEIGEGLLLSDVSSIHMCFMRFSIDAVFVDESYKVVRAVRNLKPWLSLASASAKHVIEVPAGQTDNIEEGDQLIIAKIV